MGAVHNLGPGATPLAPHSTVSSIVQRAVLLETSRSEIREQVARALTAVGVSVTAAASEEEGRAIVGRGTDPVGLVLLDLALPPSGGIEALRNIRSLCPTLPVVVFSTDHTAQTMAEAFRNGATDFVRPPLDGPHFTSFITGFLDARPLRPETLVDTRALASPLVSCANPKMQSIRYSLKRIALSDVPVLIQGESGVGKEVLARQVHLLSPRANKPFLKLNCAAFPFELLESELFGYERGAFTGAFKTTQGKFELADGGTILLDEIADMEVRLQAKLLQVLQDGEFLRLGGRETIRVNVRVIAATHHDLQQAIEAGRFRADLYYRLAVIPIEIPPLRERRDEIVPLAEFFLRKHVMPDSRIRSICPELRESLLAYDWPGNIRELENLVQRLVVTEDTSAVIRELRGTIAALAPLQRKGPSRPDAPQTFGIGFPKSGATVFEEARWRRAQMEAEAIRLALNATNWNRRKAARLLSIDYRSLLYKIKRLGITSEADGASGAA